MKKFKFTLQALFNVKSSLEKQKKNELSIINAKIETLKEGLRNLRKEKAQKELELNQAVTQGVCVSDLWNYTNYFKYLEGQILLQLEAISKAQYEKQRIQNELVALMRDRKVLEKLKEKQFEEYKIELAREEEKIIGDFVSFAVNKGA